MVSIHDHTALETLRGQCKLDPDDLRRLRNAFYKKQRTPEEAISRIPGRFPADQVTFHALTLESRHDSQCDGASKLLFRTKAGHRIETVILRIATGRTTLCVSSQVGCAARCAFCATGQMGIAVHLSRDEILDQVIQANLLLRPENRSIRNVVFMGMGEPLHNEAEVYAAIDTLIDNRCFNLSPARVLVSTVGIPDALVRCGTRFEHIGLALSLHSARQSTREKLIPLARRFPLPAIRQAMVEVIGLQKRSLMIEYLLLEGWNDTEEEVRELITYLGDLQVHINLIPFNPVDADLRPTPRARRLEIARELNRVGFPTTIRYSLGADIIAACGQLAQKRVLNRG